MNIDDERAYIQSYVERISCQIVEHQDKMIMCAIEQIGGAQYRRITVEKNKVLDAFRKATARKPLLQREFRGRHDFVKKADGEIDDMAYQDYNHTGVRCKRCGKEICTMCNPEYGKDPCILEAIFCPLCGSKIKTSDHYCSYCGQKIDWRREPDVSAD